MPRSFEDCLTPDGGVLRAAVLRLDRLVDWEKRLRAPERGPAMRVDLRAMRDLMERLGHPEGSFRSVHVAGTKGKGSTAALIGAGLARTGARTAVYASPHVERIEERLVVLGRPIAAAELARALTQALDARDAALAAGSDAAAATWFDALTAAAFVALREARVDWAVVECGLGGRLDSTNVVPARFGVITNIDLEHTNVLGRTRAAIAGEKAGIVKPGATLVCGVQGEDALAPIRAAARERGAALVRVATRADASVEERNAALAGAVLDALGPVLGPRPGGRLAGGWLLDRETRAAARLPGRLERSSVGATPVVLDGAHVPSSVDLVLRELEGDSDLGGLPPVVVFATGQEKDAGGMLKVLRGRVDRVLCTSVGAGPYRSAGELCALARALSIEAEEVGEPRAALDKALQFAARGWVLVTGSLHLVGAVRSLVTAASRPRAC